MWAWLWFWRPPFYLRSVIINLKSGDALQGVLWSTRGRWFTLQKAAALKENNPPAAIDGEAVVHRDEILFVQVLP